MHTLSIHTPPLSLSQVLNHAPNTPLYLGYPLVPFWLITSSLSRTKIGLPIRTSLLLFTLFLSSQVLNHAPNTPLYLGYPLVPFWVVALPLASLFGAALLTGSDRALVLVTALLGSYGTLKGAPYSI